MVVFFTGSAVVIGSTDPPNKFNFKGALYTGSILTGSSLVFLGPQVAAIAAAASVVGGGMNKVTRRP